MTTDKTVDVITYFGAMKRACQKEIDNTKNIFKLTAYKSLYAEIEKLLSELKSTNKKRLNSKQIAKCQILIKKAMLLSGYKNPDKHPKDKIKTLSWVFLSLKQ